MAEDFLDHLFFSPSIGRIESWGVWQRLCQDWAWCMLGSVSPWSLPSRAGKQFTEALGTAFPLCSLRRWLPWIRPPQMRWCLYDLAHCVLLFICFRKEFDISFPFVLGFMWNHFECHVLCVCSLAASETGTSQQDSLEHLMCEKIVFSFVF